MTSSNNAAVNGDVPSRQNKRSDFVRRNFVCRDTVLRSTLPGEYASLLLLCHALFGVVCWSLYLVQNPAGLIMVGAGLWTAIRAVGGFAADRWTAIVSTLMLLMTGTLTITGVSNVPAWLSGSLVVLL